MFKVNDKNTRLVCLMSSKLLKKLPQKQSPEVLYEKGVFKIFSKFTGKHLCQSLVFNKKTSGPPFY